MNSRRAKSHPLLGRQTGARRRDGSAVSSAREGGLILVDVWWWQVMVHQISHLCVRKQRGDGANDGCRRAIDAERV
jgi:hypothetical protein